jgi:hypothetical protein
VKWSDQKAEVPSLNFWVRCIVLEWPLFPLRGGQSIDVTGHSCVLPTLVEKKSELLLVSLTPAWFIS